jgi:hypothetical protein
MAKSTGRTPDMNRLQTLRLLLAIAIVLFALAVFFYMPAKALLVSLGLPPSLVLLFLAIVAIALVVMS